MGWTLQLSLKEILCLALTVSLCVQWKEMPNKAPRIACTQQSARNWSPQHSSTQGTIRSSWPVTDKAEKLKGTGLSLPRLQLLWDPKEKEAILVQFPFDRNKVVP